MTSAGIPAEAFEFYERLGLDNTRQFWAEHKGEYDQYVRSPLVALADHLAPAFGSAHLYRPYRDVRFSRDKTPYKDHQGVFFAAESGLGYYAQVSAGGLMLAGGWYQSTPGQVKAFRDRVDLDGAGDLDRILADLRRAGFTVGGQTLKTRPRGVATDHPHLDLLRHRTLYASRSWEPVGWMGTRRLYSVVGDHFHRLTPLIDLLAQVVGPPEDDD